MQTVLHTNNSSDVICLNGYDYNGSVYMSLISIKVLKYDIYIQWRPFIARFIIANIL